MKLPCALAGLTFATLAASAPLHAASFIWKGGASDNNISTAGNWLDGVAPPNDSTAVLTFTTTTFHTPVLASSLAINGLNFTGTAFYSISGAGTLTLGAGSLTDSSTVGQYISSNISLGADQQWNVSGPELDATGQISLGSHSLGFSLPTSSGVVLGPVSGTGGITVDSPSTGPTYGLLFFQGLANYTGNTLLNKGTLALNAGSDITASNITVKGSSQLSVQGGNITRANGSLSLGNSLSATASASLNGGTVTLATLTAGDTGGGSYFQYNSTTTVNSTLTIGNAAGTNGAYNLYNTSTLKAATAYIGYSGSGLFVHYYGNASFSGPIYLGYNTGSTGTYTMMSGNFSAQQMDVGYKGDGTFDQGGGASALAAAPYGNLSLGTNAGANGAYSLSNGSLTGTTLYVGTSGNGTFTQSNASVSFGTVYLSLGEGGTGNYTISGNSTLSTAVIEVAYNGNGTFIQNNGNVSASATILISSVFRAATTASSYTMNNGTLSTQQLFVGAGVNSSFIQNGGTVTLSTTQFPPALALGRHDTFGNATATVTLNGGLLQASSVGLGNNGTANFTFNGGTLQALVSSTSWVGGGFTANIGANGALIDTVANTDTFSAGLTHLASLGASLDGGLKKLGTGTLTVAATVTYTGPTAIANGTLIFAAANNAIAGVSGPGALTLAANASLTADGITASTLTLNGNLKIRSNATTAGTSSVNTFTLAGSNNSWTGSLDLTNNKLIVQAANATKSSLLATLQNEVLYGVSHPTGIRSSTLPINAVIGIFDNAALLTPFTTFGGQPVNLNSILVVPALLGDANLDGTVDLNDLNAVLNHLGTNAPGWTNGNFDGSSSIGLNDLNDVLNNLGVTYASPAIDSLPLLPATTPEPASLTLLGFPLLLLLKRRRA